MPKKVLIADDVAFFRMALRDILTKGGYEIVGEASNGAEALEKTRATAPDIVILDVVMPEKNGLEAIGEILKLNLPLKIVMCTSLGYEPIIKDAMRSGASGYIIKPLNKSRVLNALENL